MRFEGCGPAGAWDVKMSIELKRGFAAFKQFQRASPDRRCSQPLFTPRRLSLIRKSDVPVLKAKAFNCVIVMKWIASVCVDIAASSSNEYFRIRAMTMWGFDHFFSVLRESGERMTAEQLDELKLGRDAMLYGYKNCRS